MSNPEGIAHASTDGVVPVDLGAHGTIHIPDGNLDRTVRYETPDGEKHAWENPDAPPAPILNPGPDDDVMFDASVGGYVARVRVDAVEGGDSAGHASVG